MAFEGEEGNELMQSYETRFAGMFGTDYYAFSFWKARVALYAILKALDLKEVDEVILPGYTCVVVPNVVRYAGAKPIYADIGQGRYNIDPASVEQRISPHTRALIVQHTYGIPADICSLQAIEKKYGLYLIEDCAHVLLGSRSQGLPLGSFGKAAFFSFQWNKPYTTGLGGMVVTRDRGLAERLKGIQATFKDPPLRRKLQLQIQYELHNRFFEPKLFWFGQESLRALSKIGLLVGSSDPNELTGEEEPSDICWRMSDFQQRVGLTKLNKLEENSTHRKLLTQCYLDLLCKQGRPVNRDLDSSEFELLSLPFQVANKISVLEKSRRAGVEIGSWFETPLHPLPLNEHHRIEYQPGCCPIAESTADKVINLPLHDRVDQAEAERIVRFLIAEASPASVSAHEEQSGTTEQFLPFTS